MASIHVWFATLARRLRTESLWLLPVLLLAILADFSAIHRVHSSDSLLPVFCSLYRWTPYFWGADRDGMLVPFLAQWIHHPLVNLLFETAVSWVIGLSGIVFATRWALGGHPSWRLAGGAVCGLLVLSVPPAVSFVFFGLDSCFAQAMSFSFAGFLFLEGDRPLTPLRLGGAAFCFILALWVNISLVTVLFALALLSKSNRKASLSLVALAAAVAGAFSRISIYHFTSFQLLSPWEWPEAYFAFLQQVAPQLVAAPALLGIALLGWAGSRASFRKDRRPSPEHAFLLLQLLGMAHFLAAGATRWVQLQSYAWRYAFPSIYLFYVGAALLGGTTLFASFGRKYSSRAQMACLSLLCITGAIVRLGVPSLGGPERALNEVHGALVPELIQSGATHFAGDYWKVWPAVFLVNLEFYREGSARFLWPMAFRASPMASQWSSFDPQKLRIAVLEGDSEAEGVLKAFHRMSRSFPLLPLRTVAVQPGLLILGK